MNPDSLIFLEDVDLEGLRAEGRLKLVLVDHNKLAPGQTGFRDSLVEILDHHEDEKDYPPWVKTEIRPLGSTATLVTEGFLKNHPENLDERLSRLLLGAILLDTANLDPMTGRSTEADRRAAVYLLKKTGIKEKPFFDRLEFEKSRISSLGTYDLLRRDYKEWVLGAVKYGISSVPLSLGDWLKKDGAILEGFKKYLEERALDVLLVMNAYRNPNFRRDLAVYAPEEELRKPVINCLKTAGLELESIKTNIGEEEGIDFFHQGNPGFSRKKLHPLLNRLFAG